MKKSITLIITLLLINLSGCTSKSNEMFDENTPTTRSVMTGQYQAQQPVTVVTHDVSKMPMWSDASMSGFSRNQATELENIFPTYPNPTIYLYIDPHITADGLPVPGYTTKLKMFSKDYFALPSELAPIQQ